MKFCLKETYLAMIENSVGSGMFKSSYFLVSGDMMVKEDGLFPLQDLCQNGKFSCACYISSILKIFDLIQNLHLTVDGLEKDLIKSGWVEQTSAFNHGSVIIWEQQMKQDGQHHRHAGFYLKQRIYVSNDPETAVINWHDSDFGGTRQIEKAYWHPSLD